MKTLKIFKILLLAFTTTNAQTYVKCFLDNTLTPSFNMAQYASSNTSMTVANCCQACDGLTMAYCGVSEAQFCQCSSVALGATAGACGSMCPADGLACGNIGKSTDIDTYSTGSGGSSSMNFNITVVSTAQPATLTITYSSPNSVFLIDFGDGTPFVRANGTPTTVTPNYQLALSYYLSLVPGVYQVTVSGSVPHTLLASVQMQGNISVNGTASINNVTCPTIAQPGELYNCNVSVTYMNPNHTYNATFSDSSVTATITAIGNVYYTIGYAPKGITPTTSSQGAAVTDVITLYQYPITAMGQIVAIDYVPFAVAPFVFEILIPTCASGLMYCVYLQSCQATCPYVSSSSAFVCPNEFCMTQNTCGSAAGACTGATGAVPTWNATVLTTVTPASLSGSRVILTPPVTVSPGAVLQVTGPLAVDNTSVNVGDFVNCSSTNSQHYVMVTFMEFVDVGLEHQCATILKNSTLTITDNLLPSNVYAKPFPSTMCERNVTTLDIHVNQTQPRTFNSSLDINKPYYIWTGREFQVTVIFSQAGPLNLNLSFSPTVGTEVPVVYATDYPATTGLYSVVLNRTIPTAGIYQLNVTAYNNYTLLMNTNNGTTIGAIQATITIYAFDPISPNWIVAPVNDNAGSFLSPTNNATFQFQDTLAWPFPTNASLSVDWNDGSPIEIIPFLTTSTLQPIISHQFLKGGKFTLTCNITDIVSGTFMLQTNFTIYELIVNFNVTNMYFPTPTTPPRPGFGTLGLQFPMDKNLTFFPTMTRGTVESYILMFTGNNSLIQTFPVADIYHPTIIPFSYFWGYEGKLNLTVYASNRFQNVSVNLYAELAGQVRGLLVDDFSIITAHNQLKTFAITLESIGGGTCVAVNFGDQNDLNSSFTFGVQSTCLKHFSFLPYNPNITLQLALNVTHVYSTDGLYNMTVLAVNDISSDASMIMFPVTSYNCSSPTATIAGQVLDYLDSPFLKKGKINIFVASATINCSTSQKTTKRWQIWGIDSKSGLPGDPLGVMNVIPSWNNTELIIPAAFLNYGNYKAAFTITMILPILPTDPLYNILIFQKEVETFFSIVSTPIVAKLTAGSETRFTRGMNQTVLLQPAIYSVDPDFPTVMNFSVQWLCRAYPTETNPTSTVAYPQSPIGSAGTGCFGYGPGYFINPSTTFSLPGSSFVTVPATYEITAFVTKDTRTSSAAMIVDIVLGNPPILNVTCASDILCTPNAQGSGVYINPNVRIGVTTQCITDCDAPISYLWSVTDASGSPITMPKGWTPVGTTSQDFSVSTDFLAANPAITEIIITVKANNSAVPPGTGSSSYTMLVNQRPDKGLCSLDRYVGTTIIDTFTVTCSGWRDPEAIGIDTYFVQLLDVANPPGFTPKTVATLLQAEVPLHVVPLMLPAGKYKINVVISDLWGSTTNVSLPNVTVNMLTEAQFKSLNASAILAQLAAVGNTDMIAMFVNAETSMINQAPWLNVNAANLSEAELTQRLLAVNVINKQAIDALKQSMTYSSIGSAEVAAGALANILQQASSSPMSALTLDYFTKINVYDLVNSIASQVSNMSIGDPQQLMQIIGSVGTISAGLIEVNNQVSTAGCQNIPPMDVNPPKGAPTVNYDTRITSIDMTVATSPLMALKCNLMDVTRSDSSQTIPLLMNAMNILSFKALSMQVKGEQLVIPTPNNMTTNIQYLGGNDLAGRHLTGTSSITFPAGLCPQGSCNDPVGLVIREWNAVTFIAPNTSSYLSDGSRALDVELVDKYNNIIKVHNLTDYVQLSIHRTINVPGNNTGADFILVNASTESVEQSIPIMYTKFYVKNAGSAINIELYPTTPNDKLVMVVMQARLPTLTDHDLFEMVLNLPLINGTYNWLISSNTINGTGDFYIGIAEYHNNVTYSKGRDPIANNATMQWLKDNMTVDYYIRIYSTGCYFYDPILETWTPEGIELISSNDTNGHCFTKHLSTFGSGIFVTPNTIDFSYVFANLGFTDNLTIYLTLILCLTIFAALLIWARWKDKKDLTKLGATPLPDNLADDKYLYEILVFTGSKKEAQTDSVVQFIVSGDYEDSEVRTLGDSKRKILQKGGTDAFVMACPRPLGPLSYIRIWHDNSGKGPNASWFLSYMVFRDVQTGQKFEFIANQWFAVDSSDGLIERIVAVAGIDQKSQFGHLFPNLSNKKLTDGHLWFSVFMRPPRSRFTRCQRVASCFALLFLSMLVNAMWYNTVPSRPTTNAINIGPMSLSPAQIAVGVMSNLIVFPPTFLIIFFFRNAKPRVLRKSRIQEALKIASEEAANNKKNGKTPDSENLNGKDSTEEYQENLNSISKNKKKKKKKKKSLFKISLPWWFSVIAWILVIASIAVAVFFLLMYGISFGNEKATKWLTALIISFFSSVLFVQPIKVILTAIFLSVVCKDLDLDEDDADADEEEPHLDNDELWLYAGQKSQRLGYERRIDRKALEELRKNRLRDVEMWSIIWEFTVYISFVWIIFVLSYGQRDPSSWYLQKSMAKAFLHPDAKDASNFGLINNKNDLWFYLQNAFMGNLRADRMYNGDPPYQLRGFLNDYTNRIMGYATLRQIRSKRNTCEIQDIMKNATENCAGQTNLINEEFRNFCQGWAIPNTNTSNWPECRVPEFRYETAAQLQSLPYWGRSDWYGGGGYVFHMQGTTQDVLNRFTYLQDNQWIDDMTRAVLIEFSTYNAQVNLFVICTLIVEQVAGGGMAPFATFDAVSLIEFANTFGSFLVICEIAFVCFTIYFTIYELTLLCSRGKKYFDSYWSFAEISIVIVCYCAITTYILRYRETQKVLNIFKETSGNGYMRMTYAGTVNEYYGYCLAYLVFVGTLKFIKLLRFNKRMGMLSATLGQCWGDLSGFMISFLIYIIASVCFFYVLLSPFLKDFNGFTMTVCTCVSIMLGVFPYGEISNMSYVIIIMFFVFALVTLLIFFSLLITIIITSFDEIKKEIMKPNNEYKMTDFVKAQFKNFIGKTVVPANTLPKHPKSPKDDEPSARTNVDELPDKVDKFLEYVNQVYFGGSMDIKSKGAMKDSFSQPSRGVIGADPDVGVLHRGFESS